jgi:hypothetical protein
VGYTVPIEPASERVFVLEKAMSEEFAQEATEIPATAPATAAPETDETASPEQQNEQPESKTFTQEDVDRIAQKERERAERRALRRMSDEFSQLREQIQQFQQPQQQTQQGADGEPKRGDFESYEDYIRALGRYEATQVLTKAQQEARTKQQQAESERHAGELQKLAATRIAAGQKEFADFDAVINEAVADGLIKPGSELHLAIIESDIGHKVAYHLAKNPDEAERIAELSPRSMAREIGKLEAKLAAAPAPKPKPAPIDPLGGSPRTSSVAPSDKDDIGTWLKKRNAQLRGR